MRIAHVITRLIIGGAQENTLLTCEGLSRRGHIVTLIAGPETGPEGSLWPRALGVEMERTKAPGDPAPTLAAPVPTYPATVDGPAGRIICADSLRRAVRPVIDVRGARELRRIFREYRFDVVHTHSSKAGILGRYAAQRSGVPVIVHTIHGMSFNRTQSFAVRRLYRQLERRAARWTHAFVSVADAMTDQAVAAGIAKRDRFVTIRSGMETKLYAPRPAERVAVRGQWPFDADAVIVGTVARLFRNKGYEHLLAAMPRIAEACPDVRFVWVGDGRNRREYEAELRRLHLRDHVHLTGLVDPSEIPRLMNGFDVLVHASQWEGLARSLVQASLTAVPVVSFDNDGAPEVVQEGGTGRLAPLGDVYALANGVIDLARDEAKRREMGRAAREFCLQRFDHESMVDQIEALYERLARPSCE